MRALFKNGKFLFGFSILLIFIAVAMLAPWIAPYPPEQMNWMLELQKPNAIHLLGVDDFGRDLLSRVMWGARLSLGVGIITVTLSASLGVCIGLIAGYLGGRVDEVFVLVSDLFMSFPGILLMIAIAAVIPPSVVNIILVLSFVGWVSYARLMRSQVLEVKNREFVLAGLAKSNGEVRRLISEKAIRVGDELISDINLQVKPKDDLILQRGKKLFAKVRIT